MARWIKNLLLTTLVCLALPALAQPLRHQVLAVGLAHPWSLAFLPNGRFLVTERPGRLRVIEADGRVNPALTGLPEVAAGGQGGLLDVLLDADFARNHTLFFCFSEPGAGGNSTALARARLSNDRTRLVAVQVIFSARPKVASSAHFGCRLAESQTQGKPDGLLFVTLGERYLRKDDAQTLGNHHGKIIRLFKDGRVPPDNPFVTTAGALPEIWSYGHRNPQGLVLTPDGTLWAHEHGPQGGDEINLIAQLRLAGNHLWRELWRRPDWRRAQRQSRHDTAAALLGAIDCALGHGLCNQYPLRQPLGW